MELVSVIVPIYNSELYIEQCIKSILKQTYSNLEIILINDGSTDNSLNICNQMAKRDNRIKVIDQKNKGAASARNSGLAMAKGDFICFVDSDDYINKDMILTMLKNIKRYNTDISVVGINTRTNEKKEKSFIKKVEVMNKEEFLIALIERKNFPAGVINKMYKKEAINNNQFESFNIGEDLKFNCDVASSVLNIVFDESKLYNYRVYSENSVIHGKFKVENFEIFRVLEKITEEYQKDFPRFVEKIKSRYPIEAYKMLIKMITSRYYEKDKYNICYYYIKSYKKQMNKNKKISFMKKCLIISLYNIRKTLNQDLVYNNTLLYKIAMIIKRKLG